METSASFEARSAPSPYPTSVVADAALGYLDAQHLPRKRSKLWVAGDEPLAALDAYLKETDRFDQDPVINGKLIFASSSGGYFPCR